MANVDPHYLFSLSNFFLREGYRKGLPCPCLSKASILMEIKGAFLTHHLCIEGQQFWDLICLDEQRLLDWESVGKSKWISVVDGVVIIETEHEFWSPPPISLMVNYIIPKSIRNALIRNDQLKVWKIRNGNQWTF